MTVDSISVIGLGKLGACTAAVFASKGYKVTGVDINQQMIDAINSGKSPVFEPNLDELIKANKKRLRATNDYNDAITNTNASVIIVPTPSESSGRFSTKYVEAAIREIGNVLKNKTSYHLVVVTSTVLPGDMEMKIKPLLEETSRKKCVQDFGLCYNPDFIALGSVVHDLYNPDMVLIGESDSKGGSLLEGIHKTICDNEPRIYRMNFYNAELTKIALNSYITRKITFANEIAEICENMPGGDADIVTQAIGADTRVGSKYIKGALSYGGPCFPRDNRAFAQAVKKFGHDAKIARITDEINDYHRDVRIPNLIMKLLKGKKGNKVAVLGLTYKSHTNIVEEAAPMFIIKSLLKENVVINAYDPSALENAKRELDGYDNLHYCTLEECLEGASLCFVGTPLDEFKNLDKNIFIKYMKDPVILYDWKILNLDDEMDIEYRLIGRSY